MFCYKLFDWRRLYNLFILTDLSDIIIGFGTLIWDLGLGHWNWTWKIPDSDVLVDKRLATEVAERSTCGRAVHRVHLTQTSLACDGNMNHLTVSQPPPCFSLEVSLFILVFLLAVRPFKHVRYVWCVLYSHNNNKLSMSALHMQNVLITEKKW